MGCVCEVDSYMSCEWVYMEGNEPSLDSLKTKTVYISDTGMQIGRYELKVWPNLKEIITLQARFFCKNGSCVRDKEGKVDETVTKPITPKKSFSEEIISTTTATFKNSYADDRVWWKTSTLSTELKPGLATERRTEHVKNKQHTVRIMSTSTPTFKDSYADDTLSTKLKLGLVPERRTEHEKPEQRTDKLDYNIYTTSTKPNILVTGINMLHNITEITSNDSLKAMDVGIGEVAHTWKKKFIIFSSVCSIIILILIITIIMCYMKMRQQTMIEIESPQRWEWDDLAL